MKLKDIRDFYVVELDCDEDKLYVKTGDFFVNNNGFMPVSDYDDTLRCIDEPYYPSDIGNYDILKVYKMKSITTGFDRWLCETNLELIWERGKEIDWNKVPKWTKIQIRTLFEKEYSNAYFLKFNELNSEIKFTFYDKFTYIKGCYLETQCFRLHPSVEIKEEWYK